MSAQFRPRGWLLLLLASALSGCSLIRQAGLFDDELRRGVAMDEALLQKSEAHYRFLLGELALNADDLAGAREEFAAAAAGETEAAPFLRFRLAELLAREDQPQAALTEVERGLVAAPDDLNLLQLKANLLSSQEKLAEAQAVYQRIIELKPDEEEAYVLLASFHAQHGDVPQAILVLQKLIRQKPDGFFGHYSLGRIYEVAEKFREAEREYRRALELSRGAASVQLDFARFLGGQERYKEALKLTSQIIEESPDNIGARRLKSQLLLQENRTTEALGELKELQALEPNPTATRLKIAAVYLEQRKFEDALEQISLVLAADPENSDALYYQGSALAGLGQPAEAAKALARVSSADARRYVRAQMLAAYLYQERGELQGAIAVLEAARDEVPGDRQILSYLTSLLKDSGDTTGALRTARELTEAAPEDDRYMFSLAVLLLESGEAEEGIAKLRRTIELNPQNAAALNYLGYTYVERGERMAEARSLIEQALKIEPENGYYLDSLGWLHFLEGRHKQALEFVERAAKVEPKDAVILEHWGRVLAKLGRAAEARRVLNRAAKYAPRSDDKQAGERIRAALAELNQGAGAAAR